MMSAGLAGEYQRSGLAVSAEEAGLARRSRQSCVALPEARGRLPQLPLACREIIHIRTSEETGHGCLHLGVRILV